MILELENQQRKDIGVDEWDNETLDFNMRNLCLFSISDNVCFF